MSHEYMIHLREPTVDSVLAVLRSSAVLAYEKPDHIALKDPTSGNSWEHDVRIYKDGEVKLFLEITARTHALYCALKDALAGKDYEVTEYEDNLVISLERAFNQ